MRPHRLAFCALGPYSGEMEIDFRALESDGLFLIWGPTGAGKTFLLDALCFALFGEVPGERHHDTLRSDHAAPDAEPWAELEFTCQGHSENTHWRIQRIPRHERAKKRGQGTTEVAARAALERRDGDEWRVVAQKIPEVNAEISQLLGLTAAQFQQVVLLPQGRFEQVLRSKTDDREQLLRTLFDTAMFASASGWLDDEARRRREAVSGLEDELADLRNKATERWQSVQRDEMFDVPLSAPAEALDDADDDTGDGALASAGQSAEATDGSWLADQADFDALVERVRLLKRHAADVAAVARDRLEVERDTNAAIQRDAKLWDRRAALRQRRDQFAEAKKGIDENRAVLSRAADAENLRQLLDDERSCREQLDGHQFEVSNQYATLYARWIEAPSLPAGCELPPANDSELADGLVSVATALARHQDRLTTFIEDSYTAAERESEAITERQTAAEQIERRDRLGAEATEHERHRNAADEALQGARSAAERMPQLEEAATQAKDRADAAAALRNLRPVQAAAEDELTRAKETTEARRIAWLDLRERYLDGIAAELAGRLARNMPCPVCGSTDHPDPAQPADDSVRLQAVESAEAESAEAAEAESAAQEALGLVKAQTAELRGRSGAIADDPDTAYEMATNAASERDSARELAGRVLALEEALEAHKTAASEANEQAQQAGQAATAAEGRAKAAENAAEALRKRVEESIDRVDPVTAVSKITEIEAALSKLRSAAQENARVATEHAIQESALSKRLESSTFSSPEDAHSALLDDGERAKLSRDVASHDQAIYDTQRDLEAEELQSLPDERPDTRTAQDALGAADEMLRVATTGQTRAVDAHDAIRGWAGQHREMDARYVGALAEAELWTAVADRCNGRMSPRVSLQRWVLSAYLERICERANERLSCMTGGRYRLSVHRDRERHGAKGGLGLRVHDAYTGAEREVSTLSGGETFQASLSLALGVADEVMARTGGVRLDVLFVDEGFGTLDSEALHLAMDELDRLREGGRTVGLISHVSELRERIRSGIEVRATDNGSEISVGAISEL